MAWYICIATFIFFGYFYRKDSKWYKASLIILILFTGLREYSLGGSDAIIYKNFFENQVPTLVNIVGYESKYGIGYTLFNSIIKSIWNNYYFYQMCYAIFAIFLLHLVIKKIKIPNNEKCFFLFVYFCFRFIWNNFVVLRQNLANLIIWLIVLTVVEIKNKGWIKTGLGITLATTFHSTAIFNFLFFPIEKCLIKFNRYIKAVITTIVSITLYFAGSNLFQSILDVVVKYSGDRYLMYENSIFNESINIINFIIRLLIVWSITLLYKYIKSNKKEDLLNSSIMATVIGSINSSLTTRMYEYYAIGIYGSIVLIPKSFNKKGKLYCILAIYIIMLMILIRFLLITDNGLYMKYSFFFMN